MLEHPEETCWTVLRAASEGDARARSVFARSYTAPIRAYLTRRWSGFDLATEVDDAVQDVFIECIKPDGVLEGADPERGDFHGLLYGVARNVARRYEENLARRRRRGRSGSVYLDDLPAQEQTLSRYFDQAWARSLLREAALQQAAEARRGDRAARRRFRVLRLRHHRGLPIREIAAVLGEPDAETVHNDYRRGRREFAAALRRVVATHTGAQGAAIDAQCRRLIELLGT